MSQRIPKSCAAVISIAVLSGAPPQWEELIVGLWEWEDKSPLSSTVSPGARVPPASGCFRICFLLVHQPLHDEEQQGPIHNSLCGYFTTHCRVWLCHQWPVAHLLRAKQHSYRRHCVSLQTSTWFTHCAPKWYPLYIDIHHPGVCWSSLP